MQAGWLVVFTRGGGIEAERDETTGWNGVSPDVERPNGIEGVELCVQRIPAILGGQQGLRISEREVIECEGVVSAVHVTPAPQRPDSSARTIAAIRSSVASCRSRSKANPPGLASWAVRAWDAAFNHTNSNTRS